jgi:uncharacterized Zn ribbon protein
LQKELKTFLFRIIKTNEEMNFFDLPIVQKCNSEYTYEDGCLFVCPEWVMMDLESELKIVKIKRFLKKQMDVLNEGDSVTVI